jgi:hypothetical protein
MFLLNFPYIANRKITMHVNQCFLYGQIFANFDLKNMILTMQRFVMGKMAHICQISNSKNPKSPESYDQFQKVAKNIEGFCFISTFISMM